MAVRPIQIPGLAHTPLNQAAPNPAAAAAPARALGALAEGIASVSRPFAEIAGRIQEAENARQLSTARTQLDEARSQLFLDLQKEADPAAHLRRSDEFLQKQKAVVDDPQFAPAVRDRLTNYFDAWATDTRTRVAAQAAQLGTRRAALALENETLSAFESNDLGRFETAWDDAIAAGVRLPEEKDAAMARFWEKQQEDAITRSIHQDPAAFLAENAAMPEGEDPAKWMRRTELARTLLRRETAETLDDLEDAIASGQILDPDQIDAEAAHLRPSVRETLKAHLIRRNDARAEAIRKTPEEQDRIAGRIASMIDAYRPDGADFDSDYAEIKTAISDLENTPLADEYRSRLDALRDGKRREIDDVRKAAFAQLDATFEAEAKALTKEQSVTAAIDHGLLTDSAKLAEIGFTPDQIKTLTDDDLSRTERIREFRRLWWEREGEESETLSPYTRAAFQAVVDGESTIRLDDPAAKTAHDQARGAATRELSEFFRANPAASTAEISAKLHTIGISTKASTLRSAVAPPRPSFQLPEGASVDLPAPLAPLSSAFETYGRKYGVNPAFLAAISRLETANGTSSAFRNKRNAMGVSDSSGPIAFPTAEASIERMARVLADPRGPYRNASTLQEIARIYAPPGAANDVNRTNSYWARGVGRYLAEMGVNPATPLVIR